MPRIKQITSSTVDPASGLKEGQWHFMLTGGKLGRLIHKYRGIKHIWTVDASKKKQKWWVEFHIPAALASKGASGAQLQIINTATISWLLNATNDYLYFSFDIHDDWDASSDIVVNVEVALWNIETTDDTIDAEIVAEYFGDHDDINTGIKTQTRTIAHSITTDTAAGTQHNLVFILNYDESSNVIERGEILKLRFRLSSVSSVGGVYFLGAHVQYQSRYDWPADKVLGTFPVEG